MRDIWDDIKAVINVSHERIGYPTQKPIALLERIITASCPPDGVVLDPFCGCGTTIDAARKLDRSWAGIDISSFAIDLVIEERLKDRSIKTNGIPHDLESAKRLAKDRPLDFEKWAINKIPGFVPNQKQVGDGGIDGRATLMYGVKGYETRLALAQVKGGGEQNLLSNVRDFLHVMDREKSVCGVFITMEKIDDRKRSAHQELVNMGRVEMGAHNFPRVQFWSIEEHFEGKRPDLPPMINPYTGKPISVADTERQSVWGWPRNLD